MWEILTHIWKLTWVRAFTEGQWWGKSNYQLIWGCYFQVGKRKHTKSLSINVHKQMSRYSISGGIPILQLKKTENHLYGIFYTMVFYTMVSYFNEFLINILKSSNKRKIYVWNKMIFKIYYLNLKKEGRVF